MSIKNKRKPQRTCVACRQTREKKDLIRLVRINDGVVEVDICDKKPGRGAYLCPEKDCWALGLRKSNLEHALRTRLSDENRRLLMEYSNSLLGGN